MVAHEYHGRRESTPRRGGMRTLKRIVLGAGILASLPPLLHPANTFRYITGSTDCSAGFFGSLRNTDFDTMAVATGGLEIRPDGTVVPNSFTRRREQAAAYWLVDQVRNGRPIPTIWLLDGNTQVADRFVEREYFKRAVFEFSGHTITIPDSQFRIDGAFNTSESAEHFARGFQAEGGKRVILFTDQFHAKRLSMLVCHQGVPAQTISTEEMLMQQHPDRTDAITRWLNSPYMRYMNDREAKKRLTLLWFPDGWLLTAAKETRVDNPDSALIRIVDPKPGGEVQPITPEIPDPLATP